MNVQSLTGQPITPAEVNINLFGSTHLPGMTVRGANGRNSLNICPTSNFANTGFVQNTLEGTTTVKCIAGRHSMSFGANYDFTQLNIINRAKQVAAIQFPSLKAFLQGGPLRTGTDSEYFEGATNRTTARRSWAPSSRINGRQHPASF